MLDAWRATGAPAPTLVVSTPSDGAAAPDGAAAVIPQSLPFSVHALASFGIDAWFAALAWGANQVVLMPGATTPNASLAAIGDELLSARAIMSAFGESPDRIVLAEGSTAVPKPAGRAIGNTAGALPSEGKRSTLYAALDHLVERTPCTDEPIPLPPHASFGAVAVSKDRCTLCFACVNLCPTQALSHRGDPLPALWFTESLCVQCGLCERGCPERAVELVQQIRLQRAAREEPRALCTDEPFKCVRCAAPFIGNRMLARSMDMMKDHPLLQQEGIERLKLCMACRAQATIHDAASDGG